MQGLAMMLWSGSKSRSMQRSWRSGLSSGAGAGAGASSHSIPLVKALLTWRNLKSPRLQNECDCAVRGVIFGVDLWQWRGVEEG